jgi:hypothetical protein
MKTIYDLPIRVACASEVERLSVSLGIDFWQALEHIIEEWYRLTFEDRESIENQNSPLDQIEVKLERISELCDQVIGKLESSSL